MNKRLNSFISLLFKKFLYHTKIIKHIKREMFKLFFVTIFFNIKIVEILKSFSFHIISFFFIETLHHFFFLLLRKWQKNQ